MISVNHIKIHVWKWLPFCQGFVINSKRCVVTPVRAKNDKNFVHIPFTCDIIQHEVNHCEKIGEKGWIDFFSTEAWQLIWKKHDLAGYEPDAEKAEQLPNTYLEEDVMKYCKSNNYKYYY